MTDTKLLGVLKFLLMFFLAVTIDSNKDEYNSNRHANNEGDIFGSAQDCHPTTRNIPAVVMTAVSHLFLLSNSIFRICKDLL